jgi:hypothetical protein
LLILLRIVLTLQNLVLFGLLLLQNLQMIELILRNPVLFD